MSDAVEPVAPTIEETRALAARLSPWIVRTPVVRCRNLEIALGIDTEIWGKMEFLQQTGTFKPRGALTNLLSLDDQQLAAGITAVSAGNHAIAASFAAKARGASAKMVMMQSSSPARVEACQAYGAEVVLARDVHEAFDVAEEIRDTEGRTYVHPFEGPNVTAGTATLGLEICEQTGPFDAIVVPIGGGGLCSGVAAAVKQIQPETEVIGVEPVGADSMSRSFETGRPEKLDVVDTIADSLGAPFALPHSFTICRRYVDQLVTIEDDLMRDAMGVLFHAMKMAVEPACSASTAALAGPLRDALAGKKVVLVFCGSNIDWPTFERHANLS